MSKQRHYYWKKQWVKELSLPLEQLSRALFYGQSCFTSLQTFQGQLPLLEDHFARLRRDISSLYPQMKIQESFFKTIEQAIETNPFERDFYLRIMPIIFDDSHRIVPNSASLECEPLLIIDNPLPQFGHCDAVTRKLSEEGLYRAGFKENRYIQQSLDLSELKPEFSEVIYLCPENNLLEATTSHVFIFQENALLTPPLKSRPMEGIMRSFLKQFACEKNLVIREEKISYTALARADEVFLTNSVSLIKKVKTLDGKNLETYKTDELISLVQNYLKEKYEQR